MFDLDRTDQRKDGLIEALSPVVLGTAGRYHRVDIRGLERIPEGPALYVGNHSGALLSIDSFLWGAKVCVERGVEHVPYGLAHEVALGLPVLRQILVPMGAVRASHDNADRLFREGKKVLVYPGGDVDTMRPWRERNRIKFDGRAGFMRLALRNDVPIIPVVAQGAHSTAIIFDDLPWLARLLRTHDWLRLTRVPLMFTIPWGITLGPSPPYFPLPAKIKIELLEPIRYAPGDRAAAEDPNFVADSARRLRWRMQSALDRLARE